MSTMRRRRHGGRRHSAPLLPNTGVWTLDMIHMAMRRVEARRIRTWMMRSGTHWIRILPARDSQQDFYVSILWHRGVGGLRRQLLCRRWLGLRCYVCERAETLAIDADLEVRHYAQRLRPYRAQWRIAEGYEWPADLDPLMVVC
jgi:hypothetical protein